MKRAASVFGQSSSFEINHRQNFREGLYDSSFEKDACGVGLLASIEGQSTHEIVKDGLEILKNLAHRGATGADGETADGSGIMTQIPRAFFERDARLAALVDLARCAVAQIFFPSNDRERAVCEQRFSDLADELGLKVAAWRTVPVNPKALGAQARGLEPVTRQAFIEYGSLSESEAERRLSFLRKKSERELRAFTGVRHPGTGEVLTQFYVVSLGLRTIVYKGLMRPEKLADYFVDLQDPAYESPFALVHSRFSTNTLPAWELAHPYRFLCHNGEINTLRGNLSRMRAREADAVPADLRPLITEGLSDSAALDQALDFLVHEGCPLPEAVMTLMPEAWENDEEMAPELKAFYEYHSARMEPWDGPAAVCFTDGRWIGAALDRNGLRPCRWQILDDGRLLLASETGALDIDEAKIVEHGRLGPGHMLVVDLEGRRVLHDEEIKLEIARAHPYREWIARETVDLEDVLAIDAVAGKRPSPGRSELVELLLMNAFSTEEVEKVLIPMMNDGEEPTSSMGDDTPLAVLSERPQLLYKYFRQNFAQVTNPPIDPIRESRVMSLRTLLGPRPASLARRGPDSLRRVRVASPVLRPEDLAALLGRKPAGLRKRFLSMAFSEAEGIPAEAGGFACALDRLCERAVHAVRAGSEILLLTDRRSNSRRPSMPALLAVGAVHQALIRAGLRTRASLVVETSEARDVHQIACLLGFGAEAVHPRLVFELASRLLSQGRLGKAGSIDVARENYVHAIEKGLLKIMSKMGISVFASYCGAQTFEIIGLADSVVDRCFPGTASRIGGLGLEGIARETRLRLREAGERARAGEEESADLPLPIGGEIHYRSQGESHFWNPTTIAKLQNATRNDDAGTYAEFSREVETANRGTLRGLLGFKGSGAPVRLEEVESAAELVKRFTTGAMSFGALGKEAHETLAVAMNRIRAKSNSGEGGEDAERFLQGENGDFRSSAIKQVASGRFGVTAHYLANAREIQIKIAQGAKPGEGGQLPGHKVDQVIARMRHSTPGVTLISPPPHHDIYSIEDLAQLILDLRSVNPDADISVKLVASAGVGTIAAGVVKAGADKIVIAGGSGGTGASPLSSIKSAGSPWELGLAEAHQTLVMNGLRGRVRLETDGQLKTGRDVAIAALLGAEEFGFSTAPLIVEGCLMMRKCHLNTCPVGIATQDPELRRKFSGKPEHVIRYFFMVAEELRQVMSELGFRKFGEMVGRVERLEKRSEPENWKARTVDLSRLLTEPRSFVPGAKTQLRFSRKAVPRDSGPLNRVLQRAAERALREGTELRFTGRIKTEDLAVGAGLSGLIVKRYGAGGGAAVDFSVDLVGTAGQSFAAFLTSGITLRLKGLANDYVGKGLCGGRVIIAPESGVLLSLNERVIAGNTCLYGATSGEVFIAGAAGERFAVRNSGANAVVEGVGDHGCEYMTGGRVVVIGGTGRNFAAGMSGGYAFVLDEDGRFRSRCNPAMVDLEPIRDPEDEEFLLAALGRHALETRSAKASRLLRSWNEAIGLFVKVVPREYRRALKEKLPAETPVLKNAPVAGVQGEAVLNG